MKLNHNFFELGLIAFVTDFKAVMKYRNTELPVFVQNTGDEVYMMDLQKSYSKQEVYEKIPRVDMDIDNVGFDYSQITNPNISGKLILTTMMNDQKVERTYVAKIRRIPVQINIHVKLVVESFLTSLEYMEYVTSLLTHDRVFGFMYAGFRHTGSYNFSRDFSTTRNVTLGQDSQNRNREIMFDIAVSFQYPAFDIYGNASTNDLNSLTDLNSRDTDGLSLVPDNRRIKTWIHELKNHDGQIIDVQYVPTQP